MTLQISDCRTEVIAFALLMERNLRRHDRNKGPQGWKDARAWELYPRVEQEARELRDVCRDNQLGTARENLSDTVRDQAGSEAADVGNMAMMVADVCGCLSGGD